MQETAYCRMDRLDWLALGSLVITATAMLIGFSTRPADLAAWQDDSVYLATAKAVADGHGYRHDWLPGTPWQTKYPPAYPYIVAVLWKCTDLVKHPMALQGANVMMLLGAHWLAYRTIRREWEQAWIIAAGASVLAMSNFFWFQLCGSAMSESLFALVSSGAIALASKRQCAGASDRARRAWLGLSLGLLCGVAILTRSIGVTVAGGVLIALVLRQAWRSAVIVTGVALACGASWAAWRAHASGLNTAIPQAGALGYELDYSLWLAKYPGALARTFGLNVGAALYSYLFLARPLPGSIVSWALEGGSATAWVLFACIGVCGWLTIDGFLRTRKGQGNAAHLVVAVQLLMVLAWPFHPSRFLVPMLVWLLAWLLIGVSGPRENGAVKTGRGWLGATRRQWIWLAPALVLLTIPSPPQQLGTLIYPRTPSNAALTAAIADAVERNTPKNAVVAAMGGGVLHIMTGRQFLLPICTTDPVSLFYHDERSYLDLGLDLTMTPGKVRAIDEEVGGLLDYYSKAGAQFVAFPEHDEYYGEAFGRLRVRNSNRFNGIERANGFSFYAVLQEK